YEAPLPAGLIAPDGCDRAVVSARVLSRDVSPTGLDRITVAESVPREVGGLTADPVLVTPGPPPPAGTLVQAIELVGRSVLAGQDATATAEEQTDGTSTTAPRAAAAALDVAAGRPPRLPGGQGLPSRAGTDADGTVGALVEALTATEDSYLAVQGPPGTGKTYLGVQVITHLVTQLGWRVGVVAQSHTVVEHVLGGLVRAGLPPERIGKRARVPRTEDLAALGVSEPAQAPWVTLDTYGHRHFLDRHAQSGAVVGGTAWDFANRRRFDPGELDLLV